MECDHPNGSSNGEYRVLRIEQHCSFWNQGNTHSTGCSSGKLSASLHTLAPILPFTHKHTITHNQTPIHQHHHHIPYHSFPFPFPSQHSIPPIPLSQAINIKTHRITIHFIIKGVLSQSPFHSQLSLPFAIMSEDVRCV